MKQKFALLLALVLSLSVCACGTGKTNPEMDAAIEAATEMAANPETDAVTETVTDPVLTAVFLNAGKADAILLTNHTGSILIDAGTKDNGKALVNELKSRGITTLDALIITHFDKDHVGGAAKVLKKLSVNRVLQSDCPQDSDEYDDYCTALNKAGLMAETVTGAADVTLTLGNSVTLTVNGPAKTEYGTDESNNSSLIITVQAGEDTMLLPGDAEDARLSEFIDENTVKHFDIIKLPHHGEWQVTDKVMLSQLTPSVAVVCGPDINQRTDLAFQELSVPLYFTEAGAVTVLFGGKSYEINQG